MQLLIGDSNIFIDMEVSGLTAKMFSLPYKFAVPDILYVEELTDEHPHLDGLGLEIKQLSSDTIHYAEEIIPKYKKASLNDLFALALAKQESSPLVTGDKALREAGKKEAVVILGTIWIIEEMIVHNIITVQEAQKAFVAMKENGRRLPWNIVDALLQKFTHIDIHPRQEKQEKKV